MKKYHVLVLAMSTFNDPLNLSEGEKNSDKPPLRTNSYNSGVAGHEGWRGEHLIGQMEVIPCFLTEEMKTPATHIVILQTAKTKEAESYDWERINSLYREITGKDAIRYHAGEAISDVEFYRRRVEQLSGNWDDQTVPEFILIDIDENAPKKGFEDLLSEIRSLYERSQEENADWKLWMDIHGGFREISMGMFGLVQMLSTEDMQGKPYLKPEQKRIGINGVYSVQFDNGMSKPGTVIDRTAFYQEFTGPTLQAYLNYGQYILSSLESYEGNLPYAFFSYKHGAEEKERLCFMGILKEKGYRYWYDDGINIGKDWSVTLEKKNKESTVFILFLTEEYLSSYQCLKELRSALDYGREIIIVVPANNPLYKCGSLKQTADGGGSVEITAEEVKDLSRLQHIELKKYNPKVDGYDTLQKDALLEKLEQTEVLRQIR